MRLLILLSMVYFHAFAEISYEELVGPYQVRNEEIDLQAKLILKENGDIEIHSETECEDEGEGTGTAEIYKETILVINYTCRGDDFYRTWLVSISEITDLNEFEVPTLISSKESIGDGGGIWKRVSMKFTRESD